MENKNQHLDSLNEIKSMMEKSSKFMSLSGLSGISAGVCGLIGAYFAHNALTSYQSSFRQRLINLPIAKKSNELFPLQGTEDLIIELSIIAIITLGVALILSTYFTARRAKNSGQSMWNSSSKRLLLSMSLPLISGGLFCVILMYHGLIGLVAPCTLIFFGIALLHGAKFTLPEIKYLGVANIALGLLNGIFIGYGLYFWALGFGLFTIIYGIYMYIKYEKKA